MQVEEFEKAHSEGGLERARALMHRCDPKSDVRMFNDIGTQFISISWSNLFDVLHVVCKYILASFLTGGTIKSSGPHVHGLQESVLGIWLLRACVQFTWNYAQRHMISSSFLNPQLGVGCTGFLHWPCNDQAETLGAVIKLVLLLTDCVDTLFYNLGCRYV